MDIQNFTKTAICKEIILLSLQQIKTPNIMELSETIRNNFERFREQKGVTIAQVAKDRGVTRQTIYSYFRSSVSLVTLQKLADIVGAEPWQLLKPNTQNQSTAICPHCGKPLTITIEK